MNSHARPDSQNQRDSHVALRVLSATWLVLRVPLFLVLYWLRMPVVMVCHFVSGPTLLAFLITLVAFRDKTHMLVGFGVVSFMSFVIAWAYDYVLMLLSPQDTIKML